MWECSSEPNLCFHRVKASNESERRNRPVRCYKHTHPAHIHGFPAVIARGVGSRPLVTSSSLTWFTGIKICMCKSEGNMQSVFLPQAIFLQKGWLSALNPLFSVLHARFQAQWPGRSCFSEVSLLAQISFTEMEVSHIFVFLLLQLALSGSSRGLGWHLHQSTPISHQLP